MYVVVFASQKGGAGKSTLTGHVAVEAELVGDGPVALLDTDLQGSLAEWWNARAAQQPAFAIADLPRLKAQLKDLQEAGVRVAMIDTPPAITETIQAVINCADLVVIPTRPSPHDLRAVGATVAMCKAAGRRPLFVVNGAAQRARITTDAAIALSAHGTVCPVVVYQRTDFAASMTDGRTAQELDPESRSASEVKGLWEHIRGLLIGDAT